ncbi:MAG: glycoside hydrolase family 66 protein [Candidatus Limnocylindrales bacterium]
MSGRVRIRSLGSSRSWCRPGTSASIEVGLWATAASLVQVELVLLDGRHVVDEVTAAWRLPSGSSKRSAVLHLPRSPRRGYGLRLFVTWPGGGTIGHGAVEALDGWWQSPRHAAVTTFRSPRRTAAAVRALRDWHVTVVQLYDWMYRHYRYSPPSGSSFTDTLGQRVSHEAVRSGVKAGHKVGIASLAYGSVYGAERDYVDAHPNERVFDAAGAPLSLGETFYITDLRQGSPWRARLMREYASATRRFGFDGIHMDTYGPPHHAIAADGEAIDFAALYPGLIDEGAAVVDGVRPGARVLFNCVEGFPLENVASAPAAALYLELWPPDVAYADLVRWIDLARTVSEGRAVVIAAYVSAFRTFEADTSRRSGAVEAAVLLTTLIAAAGAYHHVLAEGDRLLVEGYYPEARPLRRKERDLLRSAWSFTARYVHLLSDPGLVKAALDPQELTLLDAAGDRIPLSVTPVAGAVWVRASVAPDGSRVVHLVDLMEQTDDRWDAVRQPSPRRTGWRLTTAAGTGCIAMSPWTDGGAARDVVAGRLPSFRRWLVVADTGGGVSCGGI